MKKQTIVILAAVALSMQAATASIIIDNTFADGNGSFEYDSAGDALTGSPVNNGVGKWQAGSNFTLGTQAFRIDSTRITTASSTDGSYSLQISQPGVIGQYSGGYQNTGFEMAADTELTLNFDWQISNAQFGQTFATAALFTSSDNTLTGTLTEVAKLTFGSNNQTTPITETISVDSVAAASVGQQLFIAFARESNINGGGQRIDIDSVSLTAIPEPGTLALIAGMGGALLFIRRRFMN